jgi:hypothetical protein
MPAARKRKKKLGNCYQSAVDFMIVKHLRGEAGKYRLVHAEICGQGPLEGVRYGHAWILDVERDVVIDKSNGNDLEWPRAVYESIARVAAAGNNKHEYEWAAVREKIVESGHYGPWDLVSSSGL